MQTSNDVHRQFADYFDSDILKPYIYLLSKHISEGHICIELDDISSDELSEGGFEKLPSKERLEKENLISTGKEYKPFILFNNRLYLQRYFNYESAILQKMKDLSKKENADSEQLLSAHKNIISKLFAISGKETNSVQTEWPQVAAISAVLNNLTIITGGPGTGKTTTVAKILAILYNINPDLKIALGAPTGKAASRMAESIKNIALPIDEKVTEKLTQTVPTTIHRLLKSIKGTTRFRHNKDNPLKYDVVVIDECSMIDVALFAKLLDAIGEHTKLILLGDKNQLASVEAGSLFGDVCESQESVNIFSKKRAELINNVIPIPSKRISKDHIKPQSSHPLFEHVIELQISRRFNDEEGIGKFSKAIIANDTDVLESFMDKPADKQVTIDADYNEKIFEDLISGYAGYINEPDVALALKKINKCRVLCAVREGEQGVYAVNRSIESTLVKRGLIVITEDFYNHRPIMVTSNNYELGLFNGDIGIIRNDVNGVPMAYFEDAETHIRSVLPAYIAHAETVFAMTIHKSQGSEFEKVLIVLPKQEDIKILTRELLYTAVTRAKEKVIIQGSKKTILKAAERKVRRASGIQDRINN